MTVTAIETPSRIDDHGVRKATSGDEAAFVELYESYAAKVYNLALRSARDPQLAEDICQEVWLKVHSELRSLREPGAFSTWLYRLTGRLCIDAARKRKRVAPTAELGEDLAGYGADPEGSAIQTEQDRLPWQALAALPSRQHLALFLKDVEDRSYREIAEMLETTESAVETLLFRARRGLVDAYERLTSRRSARCNQAKKIMAALLDGEGTAVHQRAAHAHSEECPPCRFELGQLQRASAIYAGVPLLPAPAALLQRAFEIGSLATAGGGASSGSMALVALVGTKVKLAAVSMLIATSIGGAALVAPADTLEQQRPPQAGLVEESLQTDGPAASASASNEPSTTDPAAAPPGAPTAELLEQTLDVPVELPLEVEGIPSVEPLALLVDETNEAIGQANDVVEGVTDQVGSVVENTSPVATPQPPAAWSLLP